ncbi:hypothetical protein B0H10DRAFT_2207132 [Mycena sp. CBHHK59/15]|nr:hypothetical protein B0H10DRAFT_2207132 [Mycena sp. CBHHK59/15]
MSSIVGVNDAPRTVPDTAAPETSASPLITLHWLDKSRAQRILWLLEELGKSPVITVGDRAIAESALIIEFVSEHFGAFLIPNKWKDGREGKLDGETEDYMRYRYFMHYAEGSLMAHQERARPLLHPPITSRIAGKISSAYLEPNFATHFAFLEAQLKSAPSGGVPLRRGADGADILMSFRLWRAGPHAAERGEVPQAVAYIEMLKEEEGYKGRWPDCGD